VKTKAVSCSAATGGEAAVKRSALHMAAASDADAEEASSKGVPAKVPKIGFGLGSQAGKKGAAISIKLGASVSIHLLSTAPPHPSTGNCDG